MKIGIIGSGNVGSTAAYAMIMRGVGREIVLVDRNMDRAQAEADDLLHAVPFAEQLMITAGDYPDLAGSRVVILAAGVAQKPGETRLQLAERNAAIFNEIVPKVIENAPQAILLVTTNPVDVLTHLTAEIGQQYDVPAGRVIGSGTTLDTARFRALLGRHLGVDSRHIHAYVVGEHGDSEVLTWSLATVAGTPIEEFCLQHQLLFQESLKKEIDDKVRNAAYRIIAAKGATNFGIGSALAQIVGVILRDQRAILTVCTPVGEVAGVKDLTISLPFLVGGAGILDRFPLPLNAEEQASLETSATVIRNTISSLA